VSILQVVTQIQESSLTFVPKLIAAAAVLLLLGGWMMDDARAVRDAPDQQYPQLLLTTDVNSLLTSGGCSPPALLSVRVAAATMLAPVFGPTQIPGRRGVLIITLALSGYDCRRTSHGPAPAINSVPELTAAAISELIIGASLSFGFPRGLRGHPGGWARARHTDRVLVLPRCSTPPYRASPSLLGTTFGMVAVAVFLSMKRASRSDSGTCPVRAQRAAGEAVAYTLDWGRGVFSSRVSCSLLVQRWPRQSCSLFC